MADHTSTGALELGASMDYPEHEKTYKLFLNLAKYCGLGCVAILSSMAVGYFITGGFFTAFLVFLAIMAVGIWALR